LSVFCQNNWYESLSEKVCAFGALEIQPVNKDVYMEFVRTQKKNPELYLRHQPFAETQGEFLTSPLAVHMALSVADAKDVQITDETLVGQYARHLVKKGFAGSRFKDLAFGYLHHLADMMIASGRSI